MTREVGRCRRVTTAHPSPLRTSVPSVFIEGVGQKHQSHHGGGGMSQVLLPSPNPRESNLGVWDQAPHGRCWLLGCEPVLEGLWGPPTLNPTHVDLNQTLAYPEAENSHDSGTK